jgi:hypothetical protein
VVISRGGAGDERRQVARRVAAGQAGRCAADRQVAAGAARAQGRGGGAADRDIARRRAGSLGLAVPTLTVLPVERARTWASPPAPTPVDLSVAPLAETAPLVAVTSTSSPAVAAVVTVTPRSWRSRRCRAPPYP